MRRASEPSRWSDAIALSTLVARSYSNAAGVCNACSFQGTSRKFVFRGRTAGYLASVTIDGVTSGPGPQWCVRLLPRREPFAGGANVVTLLVLDGGIGADDRRSREGLGTRLAEVRV